MMTVGQLVAKLQELPSSAVVYVEIFGEGTLYHAGSVLTEEIDAVDTPAQKICIIRGGELAHGSE